MVMGDALPRLVLTPLAHANLSAGVATILWLLLAPACWALMGGILGAVLGALGGAGRRLLAALAAPLTWFFQVTGARGAAAFIAAPITG